MVKLICFVKRNPSMSTEEFHRYWRDVHARKIADNEAARRYIVRYEQNHRLTRDYERDDDFDGVAIQWFRSARDFFAMIADPGYQAEVSPDEQVLLDMDRTVFILSDDEEIVLPPG